MSTITFVEGYNMPFKRYASYFPGYQLISLDGANTKNISVILTHSLGLIKCLMWCKEREMRPKIIAMDPPSIDLGSLDNIINSHKDKKLVNIYRQFKEYDIDITEYHIVVFRPESKSSNIDSELYTEIIYYKEDTHYPYMIKVIRNHIIKRVIDVSN